MRARHTFADSVVNGEHASSPALRQRYTEGDVDMKWILERTGLRYALRATPKRRPEDGSQPPAEYGRAATRAG